MHIEKLCIFDIFLLLHQSAVHLIICQHIILHIEHIDILRNIRHIVLHIMFTYILLGTYFGITQELLRIDLELLEITNGFTKFLLRT